MCVRPYPDKWGLVRDMDLNTVPGLQGIVDELLRQTSGSPLEREQVAAVVRERVMAAPMPARFAAAASTPVGMPVAAHDPVPKLAASHLPRYTGFRDLQSPEEFLERLETFCIVSGVSAEKRLSHVVPAALEESAKLWWRFVGGFTEWDAFKSAFVSEFSSIDAKRRLKDELEQRTQHPEENLKEFIYTIAAYYERIGEEVPESEKVDRVVRQMHPQLQDLAEGRSFASLSELAKAADGLTEKAWRRYQYRPPPPPGNQVARDLAFSPVVSNACGPPLPGPFAAAVSTPLAQPTSHGWPLHPAALQPSYHRDQLRGSAALSQTAPFPAASQWRPQVGLPLQCRRCEGFGHIARNCATNRRMGSPPLCFQCRQPGHFQAQCPGNGGR